MSQKLKPVVLNTKTNDVEEVFFDLTLIINKQNELMVIDNSVQDWKEVVDCNTLAVKEIKLYL